MEYNGHLKGMPTVIVNKLMEHQAKQGNVPDHTIFEKNIHAGKESEGMTWADTPEGHDFWSRILLAEDFDSFFLKFGVYEIDYVTNSENRVVAIVNTTEEVKQIDNLLQLAHTYLYRDLNKYTKEQECIALSSNNHCDFEWYKRRGCTILKAQDFINYHKNRQHGKEPNNRSKKTGADETQPISERGTAVRVPSPTRQIAVGSRPVGNPTSASIRKTKIGNSQISRKAITF